MVVAATAFVALSLPIWIHDDYLATVGAGIGISLEVPRKPGWGLIGGSVVEFHIPKTAR
jgi:hypothetical protein